MPRAVVLPRAVEEFSCITAARTALLVGVLVTAIAMVASAIPVSASSRGAPGTFAAAPFEPDATDDFLTAYRNRVAQSGLPNGQTSFTRDDTPAPDIILGEVLVTYRTATDLDRSLAKEEQKGLRAKGLTGARGLADRVALVEAPQTRLDEVITALRADPGVLAVEPNVRRTFSAAPNDTSYGRQWSHRQTQAEAAWDVFTGATPNTAPLIAIIDSGVDATHPDLTDVVVSSLRSAGGRVIPGTQNNDPCGIGHGTAVAGSAAAQGNNAFGVTGVLWQARVIDIALTSPENNCPGGPADNDTISAMNYLTTLAEKPLVMNLSLGASLDSCSAAYQAAADQARAAGIVVVAAAGNDGSTEASIPASCNGVISVGATASDGTRASYSQTNPQVDIVAPGGDIRGPITSCPTFNELVTQYVITTSLTDSAPVIGGCPEYVDPSGHRLRAISGTSFASPYVAAAVGLLRQLAIDDGSPISVDQTEAIIEATARDGGTVGRDCEFGWGILDLSAAVDAVVNGANPPLQADPPIGTGSCDGSGPTPSPSPSPSPTPSPSPSPTPSPSPSPSPTGAFVRIAAADGATTDPVTQAVAVSSRLPDDSAPLAVLARVDDFADALAGSALGLGIGPLLFTPSSGGLDPRTEAELQRVLVDSGSPVVYIMGGTAAIPPAVDQRLSDLGITSQRIAGAGREATAVQASLEVERLKADVSFVVRDFAFVAYGRDFPDAVAAGQMSARYGIPVLLTNTAGPLHPDTRTELRRLQPSQVFVLGGDAVISQAVVDDIAGLDLPVTRLAGGSRVDTALEIAGVYLQELIRDLDNGAQIPPPLPVAVNLRNNFNDVLAASLIGGNANLFLPLEAQDGSVVTASVKNAFCNFGGPLLVVGGRDVVSDAGAGEAGAVVEGTRC